MSETRRFTHNEVILVGGEYFKSKETGEWVSEDQVENWQVEMLNIEIQQYYDKEQDRYY